MGEMGFTEEFVFTDICDFFNEVQQNPDILENYFDENNSKTIENMELVDWIQELLFLRMLKLKFINDAVDENLE